MILTGLKRIFPGFALALVLLAIPIYAVKVHQKVDYTDFDVYYKAGQRAHSLQWSSIYTLADGASPFRYAPLTLPLFKPFAHLTLAHAKMLWFFFQILFFGMGFFLIYQAYLKECEAPLFILSLTLLSIFRLCLDTLTIGQISSLMFFGYALAFYGLLKRKHHWASIGLVIPTLLKIAPGFGFLYLLAAKPARWLRMVLIPLGIVSILCFGLYFMIPDQKADSFSQLWNSWVMIVANDSVYYDASHYGSQSLKSALLRVAQSGIWSAHFAQLLHVGLTLFICAAISVFWLMKAPINAYAVGLSFSLALFANIWFMPETFKYSLTPLAIPIALLLTAPRKHMSLYLILGFAFGVISLAGLDIVGSKLFFGIQRFSLPFLATVFLGLYVWREAWHYSSPSFFARVLGLPRSSLGPWEAFPNLDGSTSASLILPVLIEGSSSLHLPFIKTHVEAARDCLSAHFGSDFEILVIAHGERANPSDPITVELRHWLSKIPGTGLIYQEHAPGRGAAIRSGFLKSTGKIILLGQLEQPCHPSFYKQAIRLIENEKYGFVRGNRRLPESRFQIPVRVLRLIYRRHLLGLFFNRLVRLFLPIRTTDTHSAHLVMTRQLALAAFSVQSSPDFLCDLEWSLAANAHGAHRCDLPLTVYLGREKTFLQMIAESIAIFRGLPTLAMRFRQGCYGPIQRPDALTADDWGLSKGVNEGILSLAKMGVIRRVSLMSTCAYLDEGLDELKAIPGISLGLHYNLTYGKRLSSFPILDHCGIRALFSKWVLNFPQRKALTEAALKECETQIAALERRGIVPQFIDGHHHVHLLPGLIKRLAPLLKRKQIEQVRVLSDPALIWSNKFPLYWFSLLTRADLKRAGLKSLPCFYPKTSDYFDPGKLRGTLSRHLSHEIITHPAVNDDVHLLEFPDSYGIGRIIEFRSLEMLAPSWLAPKPEEKSP